MRKVAREGFRPTLSTATRQGLGRCFHSAAGWPSQSTLPASQLDSQERFSSMANRRNRNSRFLPELCTELKRLYDRELFQLGRFSVRLLILSLGIWLLLLAIAATQYQSPMAIAFILGSVVVIGCTPLCWQCGHLYSKILGIPEECLGFWQVVGIGVPISILSYQLFCYFK